MAVVGNLFVNIAAKTNELEKGLKNAASMVVSFSRIQLWAGIGAATIEMTRILQLSLGRFAENRKAVYDITVAFRTMELAAARALAPTVASLGQVLALDITSWAKDSDTSMKSFGATVAILGDVLLSVYRVGKAVFYGLGAAVTAFAGGVSAAVDAVQSLFGKSSSGLATKMMLSGAGELGSKSFQSFGEATQGFGTVFNNATSGTVNGKPLNETGVQTSEEMLMIARSSNAALIDIKARMGNGGPR